MSPPPSSLDRIDPHCPSPPLARSPEAILAVADLQIASRYRPATEGQAAGGDCDDGLQAPGGGAGLVVGDVQGKGVEAATLTSAARHTLRAAALDGAGPGDMLRRLNTALLYGHAERLQRSEEHTSELQSLMRISYAVFCLKKKKIDTSQSRQ